MTSEKQQLILAQQILPGYGFFGFEDPVQLHVPIHQPVDCIRIGIENNTREILNLGAISLIDSTGAPLDLVKHLASARLSTTFKDITPPDCIQHLAERRQIHSDRERLPVLTLELKGLTSLQSIVIANQPGQCGGRSKYLTVRAWRGRDEVATFRNATDTGLIKSASTIIRSLKPPFNTLTLAVSLATAKDVTSVARKIQDQIVEAVVAGHLDLSTRQLCSLLPMHKPDPDIDDNIQRLIGEIIVRYVEIRGRLATARLKDFKTFMTTPDQITTAFAHASTALERRSDDNCEFFVSKHLLTINKPRLHTIGHEYLAAVQEIQHQLQEWSITSMICYGTLLGAVREGGFIAHDDDVDMLIVDGSTTRESMIENADALIERFQAAGGYAKRQGMNFFVAPAGHNVHIDIFPSWQDDEGHWVMMERGKYRPIPSDFIEPVSSIAIQELRFNCPNDPDSFLANRYGPGWRTPDPYHEWPWPVSDRKTSQAA